MHKIISLFIGSLVISLVTVSNVYAGGTGVAGSEHNITILRGDGESELDVFSGKEIVIKKPSNNHYETGKKKPTYRTSPRAVGTSDDTIWVMDSRGQLRACTTIGTGYTGGSERITCTK